MQIQWFLTTYTYTVYKYTTVTTPRVSIRKTVGVCTMEGQMNQITAAQLFLLNISKIISNLVRFF